MRFQTKSQQSDGKCAAAGACHFGFAGFKHRKNLALAAQIILHLVVVAGEIEGQNSFFSRENEPQFQIRPAFESVRRDFPDAYAAVNMRLAERRLNFSQSFEHIGFLAGDALAEARRRFNLARH
jgi:hypothetical protein